MEHIYCLIEGEELIAEAITKGRTDYDMPDWNRQVVYSLDGTKAIVEGHFNEEEIAWFNANGYVFADAEECRQYLLSNYAEWYPPYAGE